MTDVEYPMKNSTDVFSPKTKLYTTHGVYYTDLVVNLVDVHIGRGEPIDIAYFQPKVRKAKSRYVLCGKINPQHIVTFHSMSLKIE